MGMIDFSDQFRKKNPNVMRQSACLVIGPITVDNFAPLFNCTPVDQIRLFTLVGWNRSSLVCCLVNRGSTDYLCLLQISSGVVWQNRDLHLSRNTFYLLSLRLCFFIVSKHDSFVYGDDKLTC